MRGSYCVGMPVSLEVRRANFARFVRRAINQAKESPRKWSVEKVAETAGIGAATIYRWLDGDWIKSPQGDAVEAFCDALDIPPRIAFEILWPGKTSQVRDTEPLPLAAANAIDAIQRKLNSPGVTEHEKYLISEMLESLAARRHPA